MKTKKGTTECVLSKVRIEPWSERYGRRRKIISYGVLLKEVLYDCSTQSQSTLALVLKKGYPENKEYPMETSSLNITVTNSGSGQDSWVQWFLVAGIVEMS